MALTARELSKTEGILTAGPEDSLSSALAKIHSSHDAVFVTEKKKLLGVISPYHVLYRAHYPAATKVKNCLFLAPKLKPDTQLEKIARLMLEAKVYFLPVVTESGKWLGVVSYRRLLRHLSGLTIKPKPLVKINDTVTVSQARNLMKTGGVSRLIVTAGNDRLAGILTRYDLSQNLDLPPASPVKAYIKHDVATFQPDDNPATVVNRMIDRRIGSIVMVNRNYQPIGLLSVRDCLEAVARPKPKSNPATEEDVQVKIARVRSGWEVFVRAKNIVTHATNRFRNQALREGLKKLKARLGKN